MITPKVIMSVAVVLLFNVTAREKQINHKTGKMNTEDFTTTIIVDQSPAQVFKAINNVRGWWSEEIEGSTGTINESFNYHFKDMHRCRIKVIEMIPDKKVVWLVEENNFSFTKDKKEWTGTRIIFDISRDGNKTKMVFTHKGLVPEYECYNVCHDAWIGFIQNSLYNLITTGKGQPNPKDGVNKINADNIKKHDLDK